jgi:tRNA dimethylallyltransferase
MASGSGDEHEGAALPLIAAVVGPTATGKTALAVRLARRLGDAELVNADSRQILHGLPIGTNAPTAEDLAGVPCHLLGITEPGVPYSVANWLAAARSCLADLARRRVRPIVVGGTGLYVRALLDGLDLDGAPPDAARRAVLNARAATAEGLHELATELRRRDPEGSTRIDLRNPRRVVRALEIIQDRGSLGARRPGISTLASLRLGLDAPAALHRRWVAERAQAMLEGGLLGETAAALQRGVTPLALDGAGIGYREAMAVLDGRMTGEEAGAEIVRRTLRYAKAQRTWFRADRRVVWLRREAEDDLDDVTVGAMEALASR